MRSWPLYFLKRYGIGKQNRWILLPTLMFVIKKTQWISPLKEKFNNLNIYINLKKWMVYLQTTYELCFGEAYFKYFESCDFSRENTNIDVSVFMLDLRMINMSSECEYDWYWKISDRSTEYEVCDSFASLTRHQASYSGSAGWYFWYQSIHIQITYTYNISTFTNVFLNLIFFQSIWSHS